MTTAPCMRVRLASLGYEGCGDERTLAAMMPERTLTGSVVSVDESAESSGLAREAAEGFGSSTRVLPWVGVDG
jgi:hypothetical protein